MRFMPFIVAVSLLGALPVFAADEAKPATATAPATADAAWAEFEPFLKDPKETPRSKEEATKIFTPYIHTFDEKLAAFLKAYPTDPRRGLLILRQAEIAGMRGFIGLPKSKDLPQRLEEIVAATDLDKETRAQASALRVEIEEENDAVYARLGFAHLKAFPDFKGNGKIVSKLKRLAREKELMAQPIEFKFTALDDREVDLEQLRGKVVLIDFWATWCGPCVEAMPKILALHKQFNQKGLEVIGISLDGAEDRAAVEKLIKANKLPWPQYFQATPGLNRYAQKYGVEEIPAMWLINKQGKLVDLRAHDNLEEKVQKLLGE